MKANTINDFVNQYKLSKTLRFKLVPIGKTLENIESSGILEEDSRRAESYKVVKKIIDEYHKAFIDLMLSDFSLQYSSSGKLNSLEEYFYYLNLSPKTDKERSNFEKIKTSLRKQIVGKFSSDERFKRLYKKELIQEDLIEFVKGTENEDYKKELISEFHNFTVYFTGFHENRKNMYSYEEKSTSIAYRLIDENLPKFVDNMQSFLKIASSEVADRFPELYSKFEEYLQVESIGDLFKLENFSMFLTQRHIDVYNAIIGGKTTDDGRKVQGLNEYINLYNQTHKDSPLPKLKMLFKQILSDREAISWLPEMFENDKSLVSSIKEYYDVMSQYFDGDKPLSLKRLLSAISSYDMSGIYIRNDQQITEISQKLTGSWDTISSAIRMNIETLLPQKKKEAYEKYQERIDKAFKSYQSFSLDYINRSLSLAGSTYRIEDYFVNAGAVNTEFVQKENHFARIANAYTDIKDILCSDMAESNKVSHNPDAIQKIKAFLDAMKELQLFVKPLLGSGEETDSDKRFYGEFTAIWNELDLLTPIYNKVRNYLTKKPYSLEKIKLNFKNPTLLSGWDLNKEPDNTSVILRRNGMYYLAIMNKSHRRVFESYPSGDGKECYQKMEYKLLPGANKMLPKVFFSKSRIDEFKPSEKLLDNYRRETHKKGDNFSLKDCHALIDFFKESINKHEDWRTFGFRFSDTSQYEDMSAFYREVEAQGYKLNFADVSAEYIDRLVDEGKIYLFRIYSKDFSPYSKGTPNMHTLYWKMLFDERNLSDVVYKLNGEAEVFFRKSSIRPGRPTHPANVPLKNKNVLNPKSESVFEYDLIKDKRYTVDQFQFHVPITMNFKSPDSVPLNQAVNDYVRNADDLHIIGIDRGERHLLYLVVIDMNGRICEQFSLNEIVNEYKGVPYRTNYHNLLETKEEERMKARKSWQSIENIKELKEGYLSQVIHKISELMVKYNAIVVLEDLNMGFMRGRQKVEKQVYMKFEKMLIDKLNYLVFKNNDPQMPGGVLKAYQLANKFLSFSKLGKQSGFLYYIPAWNTSKIDPVTGFVNLFDVKYESVEKSKSFFSKFDVIRYNEADGWFEFAFDYDTFNKKAEGTRTCWTVCTRGTRIRTFRNPQKNSQWDNEEIDLTQKFRNLFAANGISLDSNIKNELMNVSSKDFFSELISLFRLMLQMRNSVTGTEVDYLVSPVLSEDGGFYDSRCADASLPANADANGAFNIARKGLMLVERIKESSSFDDLDMKITNKEWLRFVQNMH